MKSIAVIVGSAFTEQLPPDLDLDRQEINTVWGKQELNLVKKSRSSGIFIISTRHTPPTLTQSN